MPSPRPPRPRSPRPAVRSAPQRRSRQGSQQAAQYNGARMFRAFANAFKIPDLRGKILFTLGIIAVYRLGSVIPIPGVDYQVLRGILDQQDGGAGVAQLLNLFSGGALTQLAIFALGIMPYITASIIMQLLAVVIP